MILMDVGLRLWRTVEDGAVVEEGEDHAPGPGLGLDLVQGTAKGQDPDPSRALDLVPESRKRRILSLVLALSRGQRSAPSLAPDPREEASLAPGQVKSPARGPDPAPSLVPGPTAPSLAPGPDQSPSPGVISAHLQDPAARIEKPRKLAVTQNPSRDPGPSLLQKMEINPHTQTNPEHAQSPRRKWKRMAETLFPLTTVTTKSSSSLAVLIKINVFVSSLSKCRRYPSYFFRESSIGTSLS